MTSVYSCGLHEAEAVEENKVHSAVLEEGLDQPTANWQPAGGPIQGTLWEGGGDDSHPI